MIFGCAPPSPSQVIATTLLISLLTGLGAAYGTAKSGIGIAGVGTFRPDLIMKVWRSTLFIVPIRREGRALTLNLRQSLIPVVMSGIIAVYSLVIAVLIAGDIGPQGESYSLF